jgi:hypothetical protein
VGDDPDLIVELDESLTSLAAEDSVAAELVKLRLFAGLSVTEADEALNHYYTKAYNNWKFASAWFSARLSAPGEE